MCGFVDKMARNAPLGPTAHGLCPALWKPKLPLEKPNPSSETHWKPNSRSNPEDEQKVIHCAYHLASAQQAKYLRDAP